MTTNDTIKQRIAEEKAKIKVDSYQDITAEGSWKAAGRSLWSIAILGAATGMFIGAVAVLSTIAVGVPLATAAAVLPAAVAGFGVLGMSAGFAGGAMWGRASGAAASAAKEQEKRIKEFMVENTLVNDPQAAISHPQNPSEKKPETLKDYVNPKVGLFFAAIGAVGGLLVAAATMMSGGSALMGLPLVGSLISTLAGASATPAVTAAVTTAFSVGTFASFGAIFGVGYPKISVAITNWVGSYMSGEKFKKSPEVTQEPAIEKMPQQTIEPEVMPTRSFTARERTRVTSYETFVHQSHSEALLQR